MSEIDRAERLLAALERARLVLGLTQLAVALFLIGYRRGQARLALEHGIEVPVEGGDDGSDD